MSKTVLAQVDGFTPCIDTLTQQYGVAVSAVFGRVWRYCQYEKGICDASIETIAQDLKMSYQSVLKHIKLLVKEGYLDDETPFVKNVPHIYSDTGKAGLEVKISARSTNLEEQVYKFRGARSTKFVDEDTLKETIKKEKIDTCETTQENQRPIPEEEAIIMDKDEYLKSVKGALDRSIVKSVDGIDLSDYPEDVSVTIGLVCKLWHLRPPRRNKKKGGEYAQWIEAARDLNDACGEFGLKAIECYRENFEQHMAQHQGVAPFTVNWPGALVKSVRGHAGMLRQAGESMASLTAPSKPKTVSMVIGGVSYDIPVGMDGTMAVGGRIVAP